MQFDFGKLFKGGEEKALPKAPVHNVSIDGLASLFQGSNSSWDKGGELKQYGKSLYVFAAINKIAMKVASIQVSMFQIQGLDGNDEEVFQHPALDLLARPNPYQTRSEFLRTAWINKKATGEAFWLKVRNRRGDVVELWNLRPDYMTVVADPEKFIRHFELNKTDGTKVVIDPEDIIFFKDPDPTNPLRGMSPIGVAKTRIDTEKSATEYQRDFFRNNARPDALLITEETLDTDQRSQMTSSWEDRHKGVKEGSKIGILEGGMKYQQVSISQREMDYIESSKFTRDDILVALGVPKPVISTDAVTFNNADAGILMFLSETIVPEMEQLVEVLNEFLIIPEFGEDLYLDFKDPTPLDAEAELRENVAGWGHWLTTNEIRSKYNLPAIEGGDAIASPVLGFNMGEGLSKPADATEEEPSPSPAQETPPAEAEPRQFRMTRPKVSKHKSFRNLQGRPFLRKRFELREAAVVALKKLKEDLLKKSKTKAAKTTKKGKKAEKNYVSLFVDTELRQSFYDLTNKRIDKRGKAYQKKVLSEAADQEARALKELKKIAKKSKGVMVYNKAKIKDILDKDAEAKIFSDFTLPFLLEFAQSAGDDAAKLTGETFTFTEALTKALNARAKFFGVSATNTTHKRLVSTLTEGIDAGEGIKDLTKRVQTVYNEYPDWRAGMVARTETTYANNEGALTHYRNSEVVEGKEWIATNDGRTRDSHAYLDGEIVDVDEYFSNGLAFPGDDSGDAEETINCRCVVAPALIGDKALPPGKARTK